MARSGNTMPCRQSSAGRTLLLLCLFGTTGLAAAVQSDQPDGEIVFTRRDDGRSNVYRLALDGTAPVLVFKGTDPVNANSMAPHWGDGMRRIFFTAFQDKKWHLFSSDRDGRDTRLESGPSALDAASAAPDGVNYPGGLSIEAGDLYYAPPGGKKFKLYDYRSVRPRNAVEDGHAGANDPSWGPGHRWIIFSACGERGYDRAEEPCHLRIVTPDGKNRKDLGPGEEADWQSATP
jgi:hypothetical protein